MATDPFANADTDSTPITEKKETTTVATQNTESNKIVVTRLDNLSRYYQEGARRRTIVDNAKRDQIENYESSNDAYVIEDYGLFCAAENIEIV